MSILITGCCSGGSLSQPIAREIRVSVDVGCYQHSVAIGLSTGEVVEEFEMPHHPEGFRHFFSRIAAQE